MAASEISGQLAFEAFPPAPALSRHERIEDLRLSMDVVPASAAELTEIMSVRSFPDNQGGAARHIAEVVRHQTDANTNDVHRAARKIIHCYGEWAAAAQTSHDALTKLHEQLTDDVNPTLLVDRVLTPDEPGVLDFLRHKHMEELTARGFIKDFGFDPLKVKYARDNPGIMPFAEELLATTRVLGMARALPDYAAKEQNRADFHQMSLLQVERRYPYLRKTAQESLGKLAAVTAVE